MMRFLVGTLVALGTGKLELDDLERAIETGNWNLPDHADRRKQFQCAPAHGLVLRHVNYGDIPIDWQPLRFRDLDTSSSQSLGWLALGRKVVCDSLPKIRALGPNTPEQLL
jgi:tRNA U38,U39,U40 pseudouridine synthase TruA